MMIKNINLESFKKPQLFPAYVYKSDIKTYTLTATITGGYEIMLGKIIVGDSLSGGQSLSHALFESYTKRGHKML